MDERERHQQVNPAILKITRFKSQQLAGRFGFASYDDEDIQQDLLLDYLQRSRFFDCHRCSRRSFARLVIDNRIATLIAAQQAACRDYRACRISLDQPISAARNRSDASDVLTGSTASSAECRFDESLELDVQRVLDRLPAALVHLCRLLMVCETSSEAAAKAGISRATLYRQIHQAQAVFAQAGMDNLARRMR